MEFRVWLEGAEEDRGVSRLALRVWDRIVKSFGGLVLRPETLEVGVPPREVSGWSFDLGVLFPEFGGLRVFFCNLDSRGSASYDWRSGTILLPIVRGEPDPSERLVRLRFGSWHKDWRDRFVHEFVHYLDHVRGVRFRSSKSPSGYFGSREEFVDRERGEYHNTPEEFNAHYQSLLSVLQGLRPSEFAVPFGDFLRKALGRMPGHDGPETWFGRYDERYRRRFLSRLYGYYKLRRG